MELDGGVALAALVEDIGHVAFDGGATADVFAGEVPDTGAGRGGGRGGGSGGGGDGGGG